MKSEKHVAISAVIAHIDHGKTTLIDSLIASQGIISKSSAGNLRYLDTRTDEQQRGITLKLSVVSLEEKNTNNSHIIIDTPGHVDFETYILRTSYLTDNFIIVIDILEGITPRMISLLNYTKNRKCILVINKIDKLLYLSLDELYCQIETIIHKINTLIGSDMFFWENNNVIIACSILCYGLNFNTFYKKIDKNFKEKRESINDITKIGNKENISQNKNIKYLQSASLKNAVKFILFIEDKIAKKDIENLIKRFQVKKTDRKNIFMEILPLSETLFDSINNCYKDNLESNTNELSNKLQDLHIKGNYMTESNFGGNTFKENLNLDYHNFYNYFESKADLLWGVTTYAVFKESGVFNLSNILFVTRLFSGVIRIGDTVYCLNGNEFTETKITKIFLSQINSYVSVMECCAPNVCFIEANFKKNCFITNKDNVSYFKEKLNAILKYKNKEFIQETIDNIINLNIRTQPFYRSKIVPIDLSDLDKFKEAIKSFSYIETSLKAKINKFNEIEVFCEGKVQFEKIINDLTESGFMLTSSDFNSRFCEIILNKSYKEYYHDNFIFKISIEPLKEIQNCLLLEYESDQSVEFINEIENINEEKVMFKESIGYINVTEKYSDLIRNVISVFIKNGTLIEEQIYNSKFKVAFYLKSEEDLKITKSELFSNIKKYITQIYTSAMPKIVPYYYRCDLLCLEEYLGAIYLILQKHKYILIEEEFEQETNFFRIKAYIPQYLYDSFIDDCRLKTKGTAYFVTSDAGFLYSLLNDFDSHIDFLRKQKGLYTEEKITEDPEKQRTLKR
ncbi:translation elongation factor 2 [Hamiltosporidium magnivora]|uniref:Translation elongation factor 2 n=1 Tax=Hamiltosporidium magnivora TaxID=148818 RepID=A0A4Q9L2A4_9MICR|nr:translation elongation factor 2 [Hamiltosporidium magnivora]